MPHIIVKLWPGSSEEQKSQLANQIVKAGVDTLGKGESYFSVAFEEIDSSEWAHRSACGPTPLLGSQEAGELIRRRCLENRKRHGRVLRPHRVDDARGEYSPARLKPCNAARCGPSYFAASILSRACSSFASSRSTASSNAGSEALSTPVSQPRRLKASSYGLFSWRMGRSAKKSRRHLASLRTAFTGPRPELSTATETATAPHGIDESESRPCALSVDSTRLM